MWRDDLGSFVDGLSKDPQFLEDIYNDRHAMFFSDLKYFSPYSIKFLF